MMPELPLARPWWLLALLPVAFIVWRRLRLPAHPPAWERAIDAALLPHLLAGRARRRLDPWLLGAALALAVLALAGPTLQAPPERALRRDALRVLVVELSPAIAPQLERIKLKLLALLRALPDGQTALIVYAQQPYLVVPATSDADVVARFIPELAVDAMPEAGNRAQPALQMASELLARRAAPARDLIWIAADAHAAVPALDVARLSVLHAGAITPAVADAARRSGGVAVGIAPDDSDIGQLAAALAANGAWRQAPRPTADASRSDAGYWLALALLPVAALAFRRGALMVAALLLGAGLHLGLPAPALAAGLPDALANYRGWRQLAAGNAPAAAAQFADRRWRAAANYRAGQYAQAAALLDGLRDADSLYNRGNALARQGRLAEALASYDAALAARPHDPDTVHNRELVLRLLNPQRPPPAPRQAPPAAGNGAPAPQDAEREAAQLAEQWLRGVPDEPATLLRRKLQLEHQRRAGATAPPP